jgi:hypothetical protein
MLAAAEAACCAVLCCLHGCLQRRAFADLLQSLKPRMSHTTTQLHQQPTSALGQRHKRAIKEREAVKAQIADLVWKLSEHEEKIPSEGQGTSWMNV